MHSTISKFQKFLIFICIFSFPLMGLVLSFAKLFPKFAANFSHSSMQIYTSSLVAVFFSISMGCFAHIIITTWKCAHDSYALYMEETTQNTIIQQQTDLEQFQNIKTILIKNWKKLINMAKMETTKRWHN